MPNPVETVVGIPGQWADRSDLVRAIASGGEYLYAGTILMNAQTNESWQLDVYDHDPDLARAFAIAGRGWLSPDEEAAIATHTLTAYVVGPGGSQERAQSIMDAAAAVLKAGGLGVKVESTGKAHSREDWLTLTAAKKPIALFHAYVTLVGSDGTYYSCGMHNLGLLDAITSVKLSPSEASRLLNQFLCYTLIEEPNLRPGHTFSVDADAPRYRLSEEPCMTYEEAHHFHNPYGMWRLTPA